MTHNPLNRQRLQLIQKADRHRPSVYRLGADEHLVLHLDGRAYVADRKTQKVNVDLGMDGVRDMGYSPAKLLNGATDDQFINYQPACNFKEWIGSALAALFLLFIIGGGMLLVSMVAPEQPSTFVSQGE